VRQAQERLVNGGNGMGLLGDMGKRYWQTQQLYKNWTLYKNWKLNAD